MADTLMLIDGNSLVHRAFHALPVLTSPKGEITNATYGFTMMLLRAMGDLRPTHVATAFDTPRPTFRHERFGAYKGTRPPTPDGLTQQFARVMDVLDALHVPVYRVDGLEADDVLGTLADHAVGRGLDVVVVTGDTDAFQLVGPKVRVLVPRRGMTDTMLYDEAAVRERYGLEPAQLVDLRALRGDPSDNIPGVPGVGDKTATRLLGSYHDVEGIVANLDQLPSRESERLRPYVDQMRMCRDLAQIVRDAPIDLDLEGCAVGPLDRDKVLSLFHDLGFRSLIDRLPSAGGQGPAAPAQRPGGAGRPGVEQPGLFEEAGVARGEGDQGGGSATTPGILSSLGEVNEIARHLREARETVSMIVVLSRPDVMRADILGIALSSASAGWMYIPFGGGGGAPPIAPLPEVEVVAGLRSLLADPAVPKASPNGKQATVALARRGIELRGLTFDSELAAYLAESSQRTLSLLDLSWSRLSRELPGIKTLTGEGRAAIPLDAAPIGQVANHFCQEVEVLAELQPILEGELADASLDKLYREVEIPLVGVLACMELAGIAVDVPYLNEFSSELYERIAQVEAGIYDAVGHQFNIGSPQQLAMVLFEELKLPGAKRTATGRASTAADVLTALKGAHPAIDLILEHRELTKLKSTYVDALPLLAHPETGRIHTTFNQTVAATGRLSSMDPNVQNIPVRTELGRRVRRAFVAPGPGWKLLSADYSQIELRIEAHLTQDPTLLEAFRAGEDVHAATAAELFGVELDRVTPDMRRVAKTANFAIIYGVSPFGFAEQTGLSQHEAADFIRRYFERFHGVDAFQKRLIKEARQAGAVWTLLGRKRTIPELRSPVYAVRSAGERMAINAPVQGTASDIIKIAMVRLHDHLTERGMRARLLLQVHDELLFEVPDDELEALKAAAKEIMEGAMALSVPLVVDMRAAENWGAMY